MPLPSSAGEPSNARGKPSLKEDKQIAAYGWQDQRGLHLLVTTTASKTLTRSVKVDGKHISPSQIHLGKLNKHPKKNPAHIIR